MNWHDNVEFGMHYDLHAGLYDTELGAKLTYENLKETLMIIRPDWVQCDCKGHPGYTSWPTKIGYTSPGVVKDALRIHSDVCHELGIKLGVHYSGVYDVAACEHHPEWEAVNYDGKRHNHPVLRSVCQNSAYYDELMIPQMLELIENYDVDGFWVDGDGWGLLPCYCDKCKKGFTDKYGIDAPIEKSDPNWQLWADYHRNLFIENTKKVSDAVHKKKTECLYISNWLYTYGAPLDETSGTDYISGDLNPFFGQMSALLEGHFLTNRKRDWDLMVWGFFSTDPNRALTREEKSVSHIKQECALILSAGGACMVYDNPLRNGLLTPWISEDYGKVRDFVKKRAKISRHSKSVPQIAVIQNPKDYFESNKDLPNLMDLNILQTFMRKGVGASQLLSETHRHFDIFTPAMIKDKLNDYKLLIINDQYRFDDEFIKSVEDYVYNGGQVLISGYNAGRVFGNVLGVRDEKPALVSEFWDVNNNYTTVRQGGSFYVEADNEVTNLFGPYSQVECVTCEPVKYVMNERVPKVNETEFPYVTVNKFGKGLAVGMYSDFFTDYADTYYPRTKALFENVMQIFGLDLLIDNVEAPSYVFFNLREKEDNFIVNMVNTGSVASSIGRPYMVENIPRVPEIKFRLKVHKEPKNVSLVPGEANLKYTYKDGYLYVEIKNFDIMESFSIRVFSIRD